MSANRTWSHMPQLDGVRAFAVLAVLVSHFGLGPRLKWLTDAFDWGHLGVRLFFVLSGFLITRLLLERRRAIDAHAQTAGSALSRFYARRFLRIFPIFYLTLVVASVANIGNIRNVLPRHLLYLSNLDSTLYAAVADVRHLRDPASAHFWSLAVEEQFYLIWPALILFMPQRRIVSAVFGMITLGVIWRAGWFALGFRSPSAHLPACFDTLAMGALLAFYKDDFGGIRTALHAHLRSILIVGIILLSAAMAFHVAHVLYRPTHVILDFAEGIVFVFVVARSAEDRTDVMGRVLSARPLRFLGKISYGIYVYHAFMSPLQLWAFPRLGLPTLSDTAVRAVILSAMTIATASVSWYLFESPINRLKDFIPRDQAAPQRVPAILSARDQPEV